jgi:phytoene synthase
VNTLEAYEATITDQSDVQAAFKFCQDLAERHYENFPVASKLLPRRTRKHVAVLYAFARIADDFSDEAEYEGVRKERLESWRSQLWAVGERPATHPVFLAMAVSLKELDLPKQPFDDLLSAFLQDVDKRRYANFDEVLDYCRRSANPVGRIVLMIHGYRDEQRFAQSDAICTALQLANFWQDVAVDLKKDRIYIPQDDFKEFGYSEADLRMGVVNERFRNLMKHEWKRTRSLFEEGSPLWKSLRWPLSYEIKLTWAGGNEILRKIQRIGFDTLHQRPVLTKLDWFGLAAKALTL